LTAFIRRLAANVKAFNNVLEYTLVNLGKPAGSPQRLAVAVAAGDAEQRRVALQIVDEVGFDALDSGSFAVGRCGKNCEMSSRDAAHQIF